MAKVAANDFARQWADVQEDALAAVDRVGRSGWLVLGEEVTEFERELAAWWGVPLAVGVASGLDALEIGLRCLGVGPGDRVLTTPLTAFATTLAVLRVGAEPVWCDVDESGGIDLELAEEALGADRGIRALLPVHLYGHPLDPAALEALARDHDVVVLEDCAQAAGATRAGRPTGLAGPVAAVSLYPTKNLGAMGDGGVLLTAKETIAARARQLRDYGQSGRYKHVVPGLNSRLDELQAAILRTAMLPRLNRWLERRRAIAAAYAEGLVGTWLRPILAAEGQSAHHLFPVEVTEGSREQVLAGLAELGVSAGSHYPFLCPDQAAVPAGGAAVPPLPIAQRISRAEISLPIHPYLGDDEVEEVLAACRAVSG